MQKRVTNAQAHTHSHTYIHVQTKNSSCLTFLYTIMLGDSSATPLVPCPPLLVCAMIQWVNLPQEMSGAPVLDTVDIFEEQLSLTATCPHIAKKKTFLHDLWPWITFQHIWHFNTEQMCRAPTRLHVFTFHKVLTRAFFIFYFFFKKGVWFCTRHGYWYTVKSQWMGQKFKLE